MELIMNRRIAFLSFSTGLLGLAATALLFITGPAIAQQPDEGLDEIVIIETPTTGTHKVVRIGRERVSVKISELAALVSYSDLDLTLAKDVTELKGRIYASAKEVCKQLADQTPRLRHPEPACIKNAVAIATKKADEVVAAANEMFVAVN
jgi:UrcA family protein